MKAGSDFWIRKIETILEQQTELPLWGFPPSFDLDDFSKQLTDALQFPSLNISLEGGGWVESEKLLQSMGGKPHMLRFWLTPLSGAGYWIFPDEDLLKLLKCLLSENGSSKNFYTPSLIEGFHLFFSTQSARVLHHFPQFSDFSPKIEPFSEGLEEGGFCFDVCLQIKTQKIWGRLILSREFQQSFKTHFFVQNTPIPNMQAAAHIELPLHLEIGNTTISAAEWKSARVGDVLLLDRCTLDPRSWKGIANFAVGNISLFQVRVRAEELKILEHVFFEEDKTMRDDEEEFLDEELEVKETKSSEKRKGLFPADEIPMTLTVELAKVKMNLSKVLQMQPGHLLELPVGPESGVYITIDGKRIAKGELVKIGEAFGVKLLKVE